MRIDTAASLWAAFLAACLVAGAGVVASLRDSGGNDAATLVAHSAAWWRVRGEAHFLAANQDVACAFGGGRVAGPWRRLSQRRMEKSVPDPWEDTVVWRHVTFHGLFGAEEVATTAEPGSPPMVNFTVTAVGDNGVESSTQVLGPLYVADPVDRRVRLLHRVSLVQTLNVSLATDSSGDKVESATFDMDPVFGYGPPEPPASPAAAAATLGRGRVVAVVVAGAADPFVTFGAQLNTAAADPAGFDANVDDQPWMTPALRLLVEERRREAATGEAAALSLPELSTHGESQHDDDKRFERYLTAVCLAAAILATTLALSAFLLLQMPTAPAALPGPAGSYAPRCGSGGARRDTFSLDALKRVPPRQQHQHLQPHGLQPQLALSQPPPPLLPPANGLAAPEVTMDMSSTVPAGGGGKPQWDNSAAGATGEEGGLQTCITVSPASSVRGGNDDDDDDGTPVEDDDCPGSNAALLSPLGPSVDGMFGREPSDGVVARQAPSPTELSPLPDLLSPSHHRYTSRSGAITEQDWRDLKTLLQNPVHEEGVSAEVAAALREQAVRSKGYDFVKRYRFRNESHIEIFARPREGGGGLKEYLVRGELHVDAKRFFVVNNELGSRRRWDEHCRELRTIEEYDGVREQAIYWRVAYPMGFTDRDYVFFREHRVQAGELVTVARCAEHASGPATKYVRVEGYTNHQSLTPSPKGEGWCLYTSVYYDDPKASVPPRLLNWVISSAVPKFLEKMFDACESSLDVDPRLQTLAERYDGSPL